MTRKHKGSRSNTNISIYYRCVSICYKNAMLTIAQSHTELLNTLATGSAVNTPRAQPQLCKFTSRISEQNLINDS